MSETRNHWLHDFNTDFGIPDFRRKTVARALVAWWQSEGGATSSADLHGAIDPGQESDWNPFNTTKVMPGSHNQPGNSVPVQVYPNRATGMSATILTLREPRYIKVRAALLGQHVHAITICKRIAESEWGTSLHPMIDVLEDITQRGLYDEYANIRVYPS